MYLRSTLLSLGMVFSFISSFTTKNSAFSEEVSQQKTVKEILDEIPLEDRTKLEQFFRLLFKNLHFGYSLFGKEKAACFDRIYAKISWNDLIGQKNPLSIALEPLWEVWKKHEHVFPMKNFIIKRFTYKDEENTNVCEYLLLNVVAFKQIFNKHQLLFKELLKREVTENQLIEEISQKGLSSLDNDCLMGIVLGYGEHNATLFWERNFYLTTLIQHPFLPQALPQVYEELNSEYFFYSLISEDREVSISQTPLNLSRLMKKYQECEMKLTTFFDSLSKKNPLSQIPLPCYVADSQHEETFEFLKKYEETRKNLTLIFQDPHFLELVLNKLCNG